MSDIYIEISGDNEKIFQAFRSLNERFIHYYRIVVLNDACDYSDSATEIVLKGYSIDSEVLEYLDANNIFRYFFVFDPDDDRYESQITLAYYKRPTSTRKFCNFTESSVFLTHNDSGIKVKCQLYRSRHFNKSEAIKFLNSKLSSRNV